MKNKDLIERLKTLPPDLDVVLDYTNLQPDETVDDNGYSDVVGAHRDEVERGGGLTCDCVSLGVSIEFDGNRYSRSHFLNAADTEEKHDGFDKAHLSR